MRISLRKIKACEVPIDTFLWIPSKKMFFFIDDKDEINNCVYFYSELEVSDEGISENKRRYNKDEIVEIVDNYEITPEIIDNEIAERQENEMLN